MGILNDIDITLDNTDIIVGTTAERKINFDTIKFDSVASNSCHYAILKKFDNNSMNSKIRAKQEQIVKYEWDCSNILTYFGLNKIFKGATICLKMRQTAASGFDMIISNLCIIFRGHNRKDDYACMIKQFTDRFTRDTLKQLTYARMQLKQLFESEYIFNNVFKIICKSHKVNNENTHLNFFN